MQKPRKIRFIAMFFNKITKIVFGPHFFDVPPPPPMHYHNHKVNLLLIHVARKGSVYFSQYGGVANLNDKSVIFFTYSYTMIPFVVLEGRAYFLLYVN